MTNKSKSFLKKCIGCDNSFKTVPSANKKFCSKECRHIYKTVKRECNFCKKDFRVFKSSLKTNASGNFCSRDCYSSHLKTITGKDNKDYNRVEKQCAYCNKDISIIPARASKDNCCSVECRVEYFRGKFAGSKNGNWRGGHKKRKGNFEEIKNKYLKGVKFCSLCGTSKNIHIHHIVPFRYTEDNSLSNLIPLCSGCHRKVEIITWSVIDTDIDFDTLKTIMNYMLRDRQMQTYTMLRRLKNER